MPVKTLETCKKHLKVHLEALVAAGKSRVDLSVFIRISDATPSDESIEHYIQHLVSSVSHFGDHVILRDEFAHLVPREANGNLSKNAEHWAPFKVALGMVTSAAHAPIDAVLAKFDADNVLLIQAPNGEFQAKLQFSSQSPGQLDQKLYDQSKDYSLAVGVTQSVQDIMTALHQNYPARHPELSLIESALVEALLEGCYMVLNPRLGDFHEICLAMMLKKLNIAEAEMDGPQAQLIKLTVDQLTAALGKRYKQDFLRVIDQQVLAVEDRAYPRAAVSLKQSVHHSPPGRSRRGLAVVMTSDGGGCHKTIANNAVTSITTDPRDHLDAVLVNESVLAERDVLCKFSGIAFSQTYPLVFQQAGCDEYRKKLGKLSGHLLSYVPDNRPVLLRAALGDLKDKGNELKLFYITSHTTGHLPVMACGARLSVEIDS